MIEPPAAPHGAGQPAIHRLPTFGGLPKTARTVSLESPEANKRRPLRSNDWPEMSTSQELGPPSKPASVSDFTNP
jgi:hypothetical protein